jgi:hypothetical protein
VEAEKRRQSEDPEDQSNKNTHADAVNIKYD